MTVKGVALLGTPEAVTTTFPVVAPLGTGTTMLAVLQLVGVALVPLNVTVLDPCVAPKFVPVIVTRIPFAPEAGEMPVMLGTGRTVKLRPLLGNPPASTTTFPEVAPVGTEVEMLVLVQLVAVAVVSLNITVPGLDPKFVPVIVTA